MNSLFIKYIFLAQIFFTAIDFNGQVTAIIDGDTIEVTNLEKKTFRIRLNGIDCPEKKQPFGAKAKQFTSSISYLKNVRVVIKDVDKYGRTVADIFLEDGSWLNKKLIQEGLAWHYKLYSDSNELANAETTARRNKIGLWSQKNPIAPWDYRHVDNGRAGNNAETETNVHKWK